MNFHCRMKIQVQLILTACIVNFVLRSVHLQRQANDQVVSTKKNNESGIRQNFQILFNSIAMNNPKKSETYHDILKLEAAKRRQAFDAMKEELQIERYQNAYKKRTFYKKNEIVGNIVANKRETNEKNFDIEPIESVEVKEFSKHVEAISRIWSPRTESNPIIDKEDLQYRAKEAAKNWQQIEKAIFPRRTTERDYEKEEWLKKKRTGSLAFSKIPDVDIDTSGVFKYILIELTDEDGKKRNAVRGHRRFAYHDDIFQHLQRDLDSRFGVRCRCLGGGKIDHQPDEKFIKVYGYSEAYGKANHKEAVEILKTEYKDYRIVWTND